MFCNIRLIFSGILITNLHLQVSSATTADYSDPCTDYDIIESHYNRTVNYTLQSDDEDFCETEYILAGWYRYQDLQNIPTKPPAPGQCGSSSPIWLNGSYPKTYWEYRTLKACRVGITSNCEDSWDVTVVNCMSYNVAYLVPTPGCGRYCMESDKEYKMSTEQDWNDPCYSYSIIPNDYDRAVDYILMDGETEYCDNITLGWYGYMGYENVPTKPPKPGQCGSSSPIWFEGTYPWYEGMTSTMNACTVGLSSNCSTSWNVTVKNCGYYNVAKLPPLHMCAKYCMESKNSSGWNSNSSQWYSGMHTSPSFNNSYNGPSSPSYWNDPCYSYSIISNDYDRAVDYILMDGETEYCDNITFGWYGYMGYENVPTKPPKPGQCGSSSPIWFEGTYPWYNGMISTMKACTVGLSSNCSTSWNVTVKNCGYYNVAKLPPLYMCAKYCMESKNISGWNSNTSQWYSGMHTTPPFNNSGWNSNSSQWYSGMHTSPSFNNSGWNSNSSQWYSGMHTSPSFNNSGWNSNSSQWYSGMHTTPSYWNDPCYSYSIISNDYDRAVDYILMDGETEYCDNITFGWYGYMGYENVPTKPPKPGQCGSSSPIWFEGTYPLYNGMISTMKACTVGLSSNCSTSWNVTVKNCGYYNVAKLPPLYMCAKYCMESKNISGWNSNTSQWYSGMHTTPPFNNSGWNSNSSQWYSGMHTSPSFNNSGWNSNSSQWYSGMHTSPSFNNSGWNSNSSQWYSGMHTTPSYWNDPCYSYSIIPNDYDRAVDYTLMDGETEYCDNITFGWYGYMGYENVPTKPPKPGQCGSSSPIWFEGTYPWYNGMISTMNACTVGLSSNCSTSWNVTVKNCGFYNVAKLPPLYMCAKYCMESKNSSGWNSNTSQWYSGMHTTPPFNNSGWNSNSSQWYSGMHTSPSFNNSGWNSNSSQWYSGMHTSPSFNNSGWNSNSSQWYTGMHTTPPFNNSYSGPSSPSYWDDPCYSYSVIPNDYDRAVDYTLKSGEIEICDNVTLGWYGYLGHENVPTHPPKPGQCGSSSPIWFEGTYPWYDGMTSTMNACTVGLSSNCSTSWNVTVKNCGFYNVAKLPSLHMCAKYCMDTRNNSNMYPSTTQGHNSNWMNTTSSSFNGSCDSMYVNMVESTDDRTINSTLEDSSMESCDNITEGWYQYEGFEKIPTQSPLPGQCSSSSPIWLQGNYPKSFDGEMTIMKACMVGTTSSCIKSWNVTVKYCSGHIVAYLKPLDTCARYCKEGMASGEKGSTTPSFNGENIDLNSYIGLYVEAEVPSHDTNSEDRQLMFKCKYWEKTDDTSFLEDYSYDVKWMIDDDEVIVKSNIKKADLYTTGRLKSSDWSSRLKKIGFNVKCGGRVHTSDTGASYVESDVFFAGMDVWPKSMSISSGQSAEINVWSTVPVACIGGSSNACDVTIEMVDFNEQFTSGAPVYCNSSVTDLTKPSLCGLVLDGWKTNTEWQKLSVSLPANSAQDQEYQAKLLLRVSSASYDSLWTNYLLPEISISVVNENVTDDYWMWYGSCFTGSDPWFSTFDWQWYGFHDEGEFTLYRHKTKPIEINTIQRRRESHHTWTEHCAIAIRAASDVFIIYGCGNPPKWVVRRLGCSIGNEYLEVYSSWGSYEIVLPTGTRVHVWISGNKMLNVYITLSRADLNETEGLCGTWNGNYDDEFIGRDGNNYQEPTNFARTWSVPDTESLFISKTRTEKMVQSFMYCSCLGQTLGELSSEMDCSWKESQPVCPPLDMNKKSCSVRSKRSTDDEGDEESFDIPADEIAYIERPEVSMDWKNGWNASSAEDACNNNFKQSSILFDACSSLSNVNTTAAITNCIQNIQLSGTDEYMDVSFEVLTTECANEIRTNNTLWKDDDKSVAKLIDDNVCPFDCKYKGKKLGECVKKICNCHTGFAGKDCRVNMTASPDVVKRISDESFCDKSISSCGHISIYGENFYESANLLCRIETANNVNNELVSTGTSFTTTGILEDAGEVKCPLTTGSRRRKKRSTASSTLTFQLVSVTNDGVTYSDSVATASYDSACYTCTTNGSNVVCQLRSDICVVDGSCYSSTSSQCSTDSDATTASLIWLVGVVIGLVIICVIIFLAFKWYKKSKSVGPSNRKGDAELQDGIKFDAYEIYPSPNVPPSYHTVDKQALYDY
ncbi:uncharacterized protein [Mytilus edulis]|uniref:uncharacterized protein isoform X4 n=1 Tax=Mytilus edulis TaxID=6550 RepID=UPI0039F0DF01